MSPGVLARVSCLWLCRVAHSARDCVGFVELWAWGSVPSGNVSTVSLKKKSMFIALVCDVLDVFPPGPVIL